MRKAVLALMAVALVCSFAIAQEEAGSKESGTVVGKVLSVTIADPAKGIVNGAVSIVDETGKGFNFSVGKSTEIVDNALNAITLDQLKPGGKVSVKASKTAGGTEEAAKIKVME